MLAAEWPELAERMGDRIRARYHAVLDQCCGACLLRRADAAGIVQDSLLYRDGASYRLLAWAIMPNHVHVVVEILQGHPMSEIVGDWKSFTAVSINRLLGRSGKLWSREYFDRYIRDDDHLERAIAYAEFNP